MLIFCKIENDPQAYSGHSNTITVNCQSNYGLQKRYQDGTLSFFQKEPGVTVQIGETKIFMSNLVTPAWNIVLGPFVGR